MISTYQSTSGAGKAPMNELKNQTHQVLELKALQDAIPLTTGLKSDPQLATSKNFTKQIAFNAIPHIDSFVDDGYTKEEVKWLMKQKRF